jgi:hypothetical protein
MVGILSVNDADMTMTTYGTWRLERCGEERRSIKMPSKLIGLLKIWLDPAIKKIPKVEPVNVHAPRQSLKSRLEEMAEEDGYSASYIKYLISRVKKQEHGEEIMNYLANPLKTWNLSTNEVKTLMKALIKRFKDEVSSIGEWLV